MHTFRNTRTQKKLVNSEQNMHKLVNGIQSIIASTAYMYLGFYQTYIMGQ